MKCPLPFSSFVRTIAEKSSFLGDKTVGSNCRNMYILFLRKENIFLSLLNIIIIKCIM